MSIQILRDIDGRRMVECRTDGYCLRLFWCGLRLRCSYWHGYGMYSLCVGPIGCNFWARWEVA